MACRRRSDLQPAIRVPSSPPIRPSSASTRSPSRAWRVVMRRARPDGGDHSQVRCGGSPRPRAQDFLTRISFWRRSGASACFVRSARFSFSARGAGQFRSFCRPSVTSACSPATSSRGSGTRRCDLLQCHPRRTVPKATLPAANRLLRYRWFVTRADPSWREARAQSGLSDWRTWRCVTPAPLRHGIYAVRMAVNGRAA